MIFSERRKLAEQYYKWLDDDVKDCPINVVTFLDSIGKLKDTEDQMEPETINEEKGKLYLDGEIVGEVTNVRINLAPVTLNDSVTALNNALQFDTEVLLEGVKESLKVLAKHARRADNRRRYSRMFYRVEPKRFRIWEAGE